MVLVFLCYIAHKSFPSHSRVLELKNLLHVPSITKNLISVSQFCVDNNVFSEIPILILLRIGKPRKSYLKVQLMEAFTSSICANPMLLLLRLLVLLVLTSQCHLLLLLSNKNSCNNPSSSSVCSLSIWHERIGHPSSAAVTKVLSSCDILFTSYHHISYAMHVSWVSLINYHFPLPLLFNPSLAKEAFFTAVHLINCLPTPILNHSSPIGAPLSYHTNYTFLKVYGSLFYPYLQPYNSQKVNIAHLLVYSWDTAFNTKVTSVFILLLEFSSLGMWYLMKFNFL